MLLVRCVSGYAQLTYNWHHTTGDTAATSYYNNVRDVEPGDSDYVYVAAVASGNPDIDPGAAVVTISPQGSQIGYVAVYNPAGTYVRSWSIECDNMSEIRSVAIAGNGDVIAVGWYYGATDFDPGPGVVLYTGQGSFIARYTKLGQLVWVKNYTNIQAGNSIWFEAVDETAGKICVGGSLHITQQDSFDIDPGIGTDYIQAIAHRWDMGVIMTLDQNGSYLVSVTSAGSYVYAVELSPFGDMVCTGGVTDTLDFDPGPGISVYIPLCGPSPFGDFMVARYTSAGTLIWYHAAGNAGAEAGGYMILLDAADNIYVAGACGGAIDLLPGPGTLYNNLSGSFVAKYSAAGQLSWSHNGAGAMDLDSLDNFYLHNYFSGITCYSPGGQVYWNMSFAVDVNYLKTSPDGSLYLSARNWSPVDVDPGAGVVNTPSTFSGSTYVVISLQHTLAGADEYVNNTGFGLYPNPANDFIVVSSTDDAVELFLIYNSLGQEVLRTKITSPQTRVDVSALQPGVYYLRKENSVETVPFVKQGN